MPDRFLDSDVKPCESYQMPRPSPPTSIRSVPTLSVRPVPTGLFRTGESLTAFITAHVPKSFVHESMVLAITSKIVSLAENQIVAKSEIEKTTLIKREADHDLGPLAYGSHLTIKEGLFIASAGIDESNSESGGYILYPRDPFESARKLHASLRLVWKLENLGILLTDSRTTPLRFGVTGVSLAHWGFTGLQNKVGSRDLFGQSLKMTKVNWADGLAAMATLVMGEADESRPLAVISGADVPFSIETDKNELKVPLEDDLYYPFFKPHLPST